MAVLSHEVCTSLPEPGAKSPDVAGLTVNVPETLLVVPVQEGPVACSS